MASKVLVAAPRTCEYGSRYRYETPKSCTESFEFVRAMDNHNVSCLFPVDRSGVRIWGIKRSDGQVCLWNSY